MPVTVRELWGGKIFWGKIMCLILDIEFEVLAVHQVKRPSRQLDILM